MTVSTADKTDLLYRRILTIGNRIVVVLKDPTVQADCAAFVASCRAAFGPAKDAARSGVRLASTAGSAWRRNGQQT